MFSPEESLNHLKEMRLKVALLKGEEVEGLTPLPQIKEEEKSKPAILAKTKQQEIN